MVRESQRPRTLASACRVRVKLRAARSISTARKTSRSKAPTTSWRWRFRRSSATTFRRSIRPRQYKSGQRPREESKVKINPEDVWRGAGLACLGLDEGELEADPAQNHES